MKRLLSCFVSAAFFCACSVGPDYQSPELSLPDTWSKEVREDVLALHEYWRLFNDPVLNDLIHIAYRRNWQIHDASLRLLEAETALRVQRASFGPDIDLNGTIQKRRRSEAVASAISDPLNELLSVGGLLNWELDVFGRIRRGTEFQYASMQAAEADYYGTMVSLYAEIVRNYIQYRTLENQLALTKNNIRLQKESFELARQRLQAGLVPELDVYQAESNLRQTQSQLPLLRIQLKQRLHTLAVLLGEYPQETKQRLVAATKELTLPVFPEEKLPLSIIRQRPDLRQAERTLAAQHALIGVAKGAQYPVFSLPGTISFEALNTLEDAFLKGSMAYAIGPRIEMNLFDFGRVWGNIEIQELRMKQQYARYRQAVLTAVQEVEDALVLLHEQKIRSGLLVRSVEASRKSVRDVRTLYLNGLTDFQNVLDSERRLFEQENSLAETRGNVVEACVLLFRSLGGGWQEDVETIPITALSSKDTE